MVQEAYDVLHHPEKRAIYDRASWHREDESARPAAEAPGATGPHPAPAQASSRPATGFAQSATGAPGAAASHPAMDFGLFEDAMDLGWEPSKAQRRRVALLSLGDFVIGLLAVGSVPVILSSAGIGPPAPWSIAISTALFAVGFLFGEDAMPLLFAAGIVSACWLGRSFRTAARYRSSILADRFSPEMVFMCMLPLIPIVCGAFLRQRADSRKSQLPF